MGQGKLWRNVSSPAARRVLGYLFNYTPSVTDPDLMETYYLDAPFAEREYQAKLRRMLAESDLASLIARPHLLPDIYVAMPEPWASLGRLYRPRTLEQHVKHVLKHLDWFLKPHRRLSFWQIADQVYILAFVLVIAISILVAASTDLLIGALVLFVGTMLVYPLVALAAETGTRVGFPGRTSPWLSRELVRATELYRYLYYAYQDVKEPAPD
jgi:hypothetical protein